MEEPTAFDNIVRIVMLAWLVVLIGGQQYIAWQTVGRRKPKKQWTTAGELTCRVAGAVLVSFYLAGRIKRLPWELMPVRILGLVLIALGLVLSLWAYRVLGKYWVNGVGLYHDHRLVTDGPYAKVRHPVYSGIFLSMLGFVLASADEAVAYGSLIYCLAFRYRIIWEEMVLGDKFGKKYGEYRLRAGMVIPRIRNRAPSGRTERAE